ncbi:hypothetical protein F4781DRAFT_387238 [Annulohypoxylon bovei var. microspora]|nr:hypothetical protein F4781DRAFT_387238 [Annulohypoxylon bovei var. microspora]
MMWYVGGFIVAWISDSAVCRSINVDAGFLHVAANERCVVACSQCQGCGRQEGIFVAGVHDNATPYTPCDHLHTRMHLLMKVESW